MMKKGLLHIVKEVSPIVSYYMEKVPSTKVIDGKEEVYTYHSVTIYTVPSNASRVVGSGKNMRCFIYQVHNIEEIKNDSFKLTR